jgi:eukaryotic-like serine/threonine-protein kinase
LWLASRWHSGRAVEPESHSDPSIEIIEPLDEPTHVMSVEEAGAEVEMAQLGPYQLGECIGRGGMAVVYRAKMVGPFGFEKQLVVKRLQPSLIERREFVELFVEEARITAQLGHPGIVQVHDFGVIDGAPFLVMELLDGVNLAQVVRELDGDRLPVDVVVVIVTQLCHALGYAHSFRDSLGVRRQVVHGDVSPSNVMVCKDGSAKLLDFGVAKLLGEFDFELPPFLTGKSAYMAPEQLRRQPFDRRVDVFAAGIVLHELLAGRRLFAAQNDMETLHRVLAGVVDRPSRWNPGVPRALDAVVLRALEPDPGARWESGEEMARALEMACRVSGGRRRVAEYLEELFVRPRDAESSERTALEPSPAPLAPPPVEEVPKRPVAQPFRSRPRPPSITEMVRPLPSPQPRRAWPLLALSLMAGFAAATAIPLLGRHVRRPAPVVQERPRHTPQRLRVHLPPSPSPVVVPAVVLAVTPAAPPTRPTPHRQVRHIAAPAPAAVEAPPPIEKPAPTIQDGRLLDPFGPFGEP